MHADPVTADPHVLHEGHHPTPFTAEEIRAATPRGRTLTVHQEAGGPGAGVTSIRITYAEVSEDGAVQVRATDGPQSPAPLEVTWLQLQGHASFPTATTARERVVLDHTLGRLDCWRYTATDGDEVDTFWFDVARPGMPVLVESRRGGELVSTMTVVADEVVGED